MEKILDNRVAIVTGAGSGMGKATAILFAAEGAKVIISDINAGRVDQVVKEIVSKGGTATGIVTNVAKEEDVTKMIDAAIVNYGELNILVNNAGVMDDFSPVAEVSNELWNKVIGVNLNGPFYACRLAIPLMLKQGKGVIINVSSIGGLNGARAGAAYTSSKHALIGLTKNIGYMYSSKGIRCNGIAPGGVNTNIMDGVKPNNAGLEIISKGMASNPRMGEPFEIAELALFLASDKSSNINGAVIIADGGWTAY
jgi:NAD(P)-dependent dehydrogenase (short-subunit alcohol dehydrogenase family)